MGRDGQGQGMRRQAARQQSGATVWPAVAPVPTRRPIGLEPTPRFAGCRHHNPPLRQRRAAGADWHRTAVHPPRVPQPLARGQHGGRREVTGRGPAQSMRALDAKAGPDEERSPGLLQGRVLHRHQAAQERSVAERSSDGPCRNNRRPVADASRVDTVRSTVQPSAMRLHPPRLGGILETSLYVEDLDRARAFYEHLFGLEVFFQDSRMCALGCAPGQVLLLFRGGSTEAPAPVPGGVIPPHGARGVAHLCFSIPLGELAAWEDHLRAAGVAVESRVTWRGGGTSLYFRDPDGHSLEVATPGLWPNY